jgi:hypothetical protein
VDLDRPHRLAQPQGLARPPPGRRECDEQALDRREQEISSAKARLEHPPGVQRLVDRVAREVQQRGDHLGPREHGPAPGLPLPGQARQRSPQVRGPARFGVGVA